MKALLILTALTLSSPTFASTLFDCTTTNGKQLLLTEHGDTLTYRFGKTNRPELVFSIKKNDAVYRPWAGIGRYINDAIDPPNGNTTYTIFRSADKHTHRTEQGVYVDTPTKLVTLLCHPKKVRTDKLESLTGIPQEAM